ncbi:MAG TPA: glycosyltransferase family 4 protein [Gemmataceae bacterium]|nr:glycosyltransferase family 4 protein [Gemmataceae bacterium]
MRALQGSASDGRRIELHALLYNDEQPRLDPAYLEDPECFHAEGCGSHKWRFFRRYMSLCRRWQPELVIVDHIHLAVIPWLCRPLAGRNYALFCHGVEFDEPLSGLRLKAFRGACRRLCNSQFTTSRLQAKFPEQLLQPCELGLDDLSLAGATNVEVDSLPDALGTARQLGEHAILIVSRLASSERYKGHDQLIRAMPALRKAVPTAQLIIAGDGDDRERLTELARQSTCGDAILFAGFAPPGKLAALFRQARLFAMPSRGEGFGLVYLEAMRFAKPCIASCLDGGAEVVADGVTGILVDPDDRNELGNALERLLCDDKLAEKMGQAGLQRFTDHYQFEHFRARLRRRLGELLPLDESAAATAQPDDSLISQEVI